MWHAGTQVPARDANVKLTSGCGSGLACHGLRIFPASKSGTEAAEANLSAAGIVDAALGKAVVFGGGLI